MYVTNNIDNYVSSQLMDSFFILLLLCRPKRNVSKLNMVSVNFPYEFSRDLDVKAIHKSQFDKISDYDFLL